MTGRAVPDGGGGSLRELARFAEAWAPELRAEDEALASSLEFVALRLRRIAERDEEPPMVRETPETG